jgi:membrane associated rhomboid family serine protease
VSTPDPSAPAEVPVCYRHPDRETYIRCTRCERPICPDCMTSAAVGFQCPECVAQGRAEVRPVRTALGVRRPSRPTVTYVIVALTVLAFGYEYLVGVEKFSAQWSMVPAYIAANNEYYRLFSSMVVHYGLLHIGFNMYVLWVLGRTLEQELGHTRFAVLYVVAGFGGSVASFWFSSPLVQAGGASGAIFGLMGAFFVVARRLGGDARQVLVLIGINIVLGFAVSGIDWRAHLGGLVTGALLGALFAYAPARGRVPLEIAGVAAVVVVLVVLTLLRDQMLTEQLAAAGVLDLIPPSA